MSDASDFDAVRDGIGVDTGTSSGDEETVAAAYAALDRLESQNQALQEERDLLQSRLSGQTKLTGMLQERSEKAEALLRDAVDLVDTQTISEQGWHDDVIDYFRALSPTQETDPRCPTCRANFHEPAGYAHRHDTKTPCPGLPTCRAGTFCPDPWHTPPTQETDPG